MAEEKARAFQGGVIVLYGKDAEEGHFLSNDVIQWKGGDCLKAKFIWTLCFAGLWTAISSCLAVGWAEGVTYVFPCVYTWWVIVGIALLPGFLMSGMFFSNLLHWDLPSYPKTAEDITVIMCAHNEVQTIARAIRAILDQRYAGRIRLLVVDNASVDGTKEEILRMQLEASPWCSVEYVFCSRQGKHHALNVGLALVQTPYFITVDADTYLESRAVQQIMDHIIARNSACVAGNLFVQNTAASLSTKMQTYDYLLSIAAIKRFQGSYLSTLVAQGAFSAYRTKDVNALGGWQDMVGEDIVLTYQLLQQGLSSTYEPRAVGYTVVPETISGLYNQRKRWAMGMLDGFSCVPLWRQGTAYSRYFAFVNLSVLYLDLAFLFGFLPGVLLAFLGCFYLVGVLTLVTLGVCLLLFLSIYLYQKRLGIPFQNNFLGFLCFLLLFQVVQSVAALHGYLARLFGRKETWK